MNVFITNIFEQIEKDKGLIGFILLGLVFVVVLVIPFTPKFDAPELGLKLLFVLVSVIALIIIYFTAPKVTHEVIV